MQPDTLNTTPPQLQPQPNRPKSKRLIVIAAAAVVIVAAGVAVWLTRPAGNQAKAPAAESLFYDVLGNAAQQPIVRVGMYRATFPDKIAADAGINPAAESSTVSEIDTGAGDYRNLYVYRNVGDTNVTMGRCLGLRDSRNFSPSAQRPASIKAAAQNLGTIQESPERLPFSPCPQLGLYPTGSPDHAAARLSDGIFPVTLTKAQSDKWVIKMKAAALFDVRDEGLVTKDGRPLRKLSFAPKAGVTKVNEQLYDIFYEAGEIDQIKAMNNPEARYQYEFIAVGVVNHGDVSGFYLVDEVTKLPVYSELKGLAPDRPMTSPADAAGNNLARTKQNYAFSGPLKLDASSKLDFVP